MTKNDNDTLLKDVVLFEFDNQLIKKAEFVYNGTKEKFINGMELESINGTRRSNLIHKSNDQGFHIRLHGKDSKDTSTTPFGQIITKQQYWLNNNKVQDVIDVSGKGIELD